MANYEVPVDYYKAELAKKDAEIEQLTAALETIKRLSYTVWADKPQSLVYRTADDALKPIEV